MNGNKEQVRRSSQLTYVPKYLIKIIVDKTKQVNVDSEKMICKDLKQSIRNGS